MYTVPNSGLLILLRLNSMINSRLFQSSSDFNPSVIMENYDDSNCITIHHGESSSFLRTISDRAISLVVTSPPYNIGKSYERKQNITTYLSGQEELISELVRILKDDGSICWQIGNYVDEGEVFPLDVFYYHIFKKHGLKLRNRIIWHFEHGLHASKRFSGRYETILWFTKSDNYTFNLEEWKTGVWDIPNVKANHVEKTNHPCQFPVELVERCVLALTNKNDRVLDPYSGVGSTLLAALMHERKAVGVEKEEEYIAISRERIYQLINGTLKTRRLGQPVHKPSGHEKVSQVPLEWKHFSNGEN